MQSDQCLCFPCLDSIIPGERGGSVVECRTPEREVGGSKPTAAVLCPWARHFTPWKYWLITQEAMAPSRHDWKIVDWDVKPQHKQKYNTYICYSQNFKSLPSFCGCAGQFESYLVENPKGRFSCDEAHIIQSCILKNKHKNNWARPWENVSYVICKQQRCRSACASTQSDQRPLLFTA